MSNYVEIIETVKGVEQHFLLNLELISFIDASISTIEIMPRESLKEEFQTKPLYNAPLVIPTSFATVKIPCYGNTEQEAKERRSNLYNKIYSCISAKQKRIKEIRV